MSEEELFTEREEWPLCEECQKRHNPMAKAEIVRVWRARMLANLEIFVGAVENDDVEMGIHAMMDMGRMTDEIGIDMCRSSFGTPRMLNTSVRFATDMVYERQSSTRWAEALKERGGIESIEFHE